MPVSLIFYVSLPPATITSVPIYDSKWGVGTLDTVQFYSCCGKSICGGYVHSCLSAYALLRNVWKRWELSILQFRELGQNTRRKVERLMKWVEANVLVPFVHGQLSSPRNWREKALELYARAAKLMIAASGGHYNTMHLLVKCFEKGYVSRESIHSTLAVYNYFCADMRSKARDACIWVMTGTDLTWITSTTILKYALIDIHVFFAT